MTLNQSRDLMNLRQSFVDCSAETFESTEKIAKLHTHAMTNNSSYIFNVPFGPRFVLITS